MTIVYNSIVFGFLFNNSNPLLHIQWGYVGVIPPYCGHTHKGASEKNEINADCPSRWVKKANM